MRSPIPGISLLSRGIPGRGALLLIGALASPLSAQSQTQSKQTLVVGPGETHTSISAAIAAAYPGDRILVRPGRYTESTILVDRSLTIEGDGTGDAVLDGEGEHEIMVIEADSVTVRGLVFRNVGISFTEDRAALRVEDARFCTVENNRFEEAFFGIYLAQSGDCLIKGNTLIASNDRETYSGNGIHLWYSARVEVENNVIRGHRDGIYFEFVEDSRVEGNVSEDNLRYGLHFMFSDRCRYLRNRFAENGAGVAVMYTENVEIAENDFDHNWGNAAFGLLLKDINDSSIHGNRFFRNSVALHAEGANRLSVTGNEFQENGWAVKIMANSENAIFEGNNFSGNSFDVATNSRRSWSTFTGNYWDEYRGYDLDRDGSGDVPFRPVRLFSLMVEQNRPNLILLRSFLVDLLDTAEAVFPSLTPETLQDERPAMRPLPTRWRGR